MNDVCKFQFPQICRDFSDRNFEDRIRVAGSFVREFIGAGAPPERGAGDSRAQSLQNRFIDMCPEGCQASASAGVGNFAVDCIWTEEDGGRRVLLAAESVRGTDSDGRKGWAGVEHGLAKLLAVKAPFKVLLFSSCAEPYTAKQASGMDFSYEQAKDRLQDSLQHYAHHLPGETYLFLDFPQTGETGSDGECRAFFWVSRNRGAQAVVFEECAPDPLKPPQAAEVGAV